MADKITNSYADSVVGQAKTSLSEDSIRIEPYTGLYQRVEKVLETSHNIESELNQIILGLFGTSNVEMKGEVNEKSTNNVSDKIDELDKVLNRLYSDIEKLKSKL